MVQATLDGFCNTFDGCVTLAYADLSTQLVLATNSDTEETRDALNLLCEEARLVLDGGHLGVVGTKSGFRVFLRDLVEPSDGLICICTLQTDMAAFLPAAQDCLADLSIAGEQA